MTRQTAIEQKRTKEFVVLCRRHSLALSQAQQALENGYSKIAQGVLAQAAAIQVQIEQNVREGQYSAMLSERAQLGQKLQAALASHQTAAARQLAQDLAALDKLIEAV